MTRRGPASVPDRIAAAGGLRAGVARRVARETGAPEATVYGVGSFYHLLSEPDTQLRICQGLSCSLAGASEALAAARAAGHRAEGCSCLAACDAAPTGLQERELQPRLDPYAGAWTRHVGPERDPDSQAIDLAGPPSWDCVAFAKAMAAGTDGVLAELERAGLQGRGGAGFPAHVKWRAVAAESREPKFVVLNADEGEPGTFKDREVLLRRPDRVLEGLAIAALTVGARDVYLYLRGAFASALELLSSCAEQAPFEDVSFHLRTGHGAYICGEETALLEALEGRRGMPRLKPPYPTERGLFGDPTLVHNVETIACVPAIVARGGAWFREQGRTEPGTKLFSVSGHVRRPGVYELPLGVSLDELVAAAGGYEGELKAFSPGGASSGFLPAAARSLPLSFGAMADAGSLLGSAGVVVLNDTVDMGRAALAGLRFFEEECCGQCAPCRIGTRWLRERLEQHLAGDAGALDGLGEVAWELREGSICGLGQVAAAPLTSVLKHFPEELEP